MRDWVRWLIALAGGLNTGQEPAGQVDSPLKVIEKRQGRAFPVIADVGDGSAVLAETRHDGNIQLCNSSVLRKFSYGAMRFAYCDPTPLTVIESESLLLAIDSILSVQPLAEAGDRRKAAGVGHPNNTASCLARRGSRLVIPKSPAEV